MRIGIDLMGSDRSPYVLYPAVIQASKQLGSAASFVVFASEKVIKKLLSEESLPCIEFVSAADEISMDDDPVKAIRLKKQSSIVLGIQALKKKKIDAFVSCGNTGALIAAATLFLPKLPGVIRPALLAMLPTEKGSVAVLDVGGRVLCKAKHLTQFAFLGAAFQRAFCGIEQPKVGLLNIGAESKKGTSEVRRAHQLLQDCGSSSIKFVGNVEARDLFAGDVDVLVTDGFTGNVMLKTAEGVAELILKVLKRKARVVAKEIGEQFDYKQYPGALLCGIDRLVIKVHGNGLQEAFLSSILAASSYIEGKILQKMKKNLELLTK